MIDITPIPNRLTRPDTIDDDADSFFGKLPQFGADLIALQANFNAIAAGGAYAIPYVIAPQASLPSAGGGKIATNSSASSFSTATTLYIDGADSRGVSTHSLLDGMFASASTVKGGMRFVNQGDPSKWASFRVTGWTFNPANGPFGIGTLTVECDGFSSTNPFAVDDAVLLFFQRTGDKGDAGSLTSILWVRDQKSSGVAGGSSVAGSQTRTLNTTLANTISGASLSGNQLTLPAGTYRLNAIAPAVGVSGHQLSIYNVTDGVTLAYGQSMYTASAGSENSQARIAPVQFTLSATKVLRVDHWTASASTTNGLGRASSSPQGEAYAEVFIEKVA